MVLEAIGEAALAAMGETALGAAEARETSFEAAVETTLAVAGEVALGARVEVEAEDVKSEAWARLQTKAEAESHTEGWAEA